MKHGCKIYIVHTLFSGSFLVGETVTYSGFSRKYFFCVNVNLLIIDPNWYIFFFSSNVKLIQLGCSQFSRTILLIRYYWSICHFFPFISCNPNFGFQPYICIYIVLTTKCKMKKYECNSLEAYIIVQTLFNVHHTFEWLVKHIRINRRK